MPKVKSDSVTDKRSEGSGWNGGQLFGSENTETTFTGGGFKDKEKAKDTLRQLEGRDISYQYQVINSMYNRAKVILKRTKDTEKCTNLQEAIDVFTAWLDDYKTHSRSKENLGYLPLDTVLTFRGLAEEEGVLPESKDGRPNFLEVYEGVEGDVKKLRVKKVIMFGCTPGSMCTVAGEGEVTWDIHRNRNLKPIVDKINKEDMPLYTSKGNPTKVHLELIMWGYSPETSKVKKLGIALKGKSSEKSNGKSDEDSS